MTLLGEYVRARTTSRAGRRDTLIYGAAYGGAGPIAATANVAPALVRASTAVPAGDRKALRAQRELARRLAFSGLLPVW